MAKGYVSSCAICGGVFPCEIHGDSLPSTAKTPSEFYSPPVLPMGRVRLASPVRSEDTLMAVGLGKAADRGEYLFTMNPQGAVSIVLPDSSLLGVRPAEFEWVEITQPLTNRQRGGWIALDKDPTPFTQLRGATP